LVGDDEAARAAQLAGDFTEPGELSFAKQNSGTGTKVERSH
jgi:hypothetical protein